MQKHHDPDRCNRKIRFIIAIERKALVGFVLVPFANQQKEHKSCEGIKISGSRSGKDFIITLQRQGQNTQTDGQVNVDDLVAEIFICRKQVFVAAVKQHGKRKKDVYPSEKIPVFLIQFPAERQIFGHAQQHDVPESKTGNANLDQKLTVGSGLFLALKLIQIDLWNVMDGCQQFDKVPQC